MVYFVLATLFLIYILLSMLLFKVQQYDFNFYAFGHYATRNYKFLMLELLLAMICMGVDRQIVIQNSLLVELIAKGLLLFALYLSLKSIAYLAIRIVYKV
jgi:hypothetical protein